MNSRSETLVWKASRKIDGGKYSEFRRHIPPSRRYHGGGTTHHVHHTPFPHSSSSAPQPPISSRSIPRSSVIPSVFNLGQDLLPTENDETELLQQQQNIKRRIQRSNQFPGRHLTTTTTPEIQPVIRPRQATKKQPQRQHDSKVILEYTVTQGEYVIDAVVVKEPFRDRFEIYGIDVLSGQRFELFIPSEAVFDILSGDMLVTTIEKPEVWKEVVQRITLLEVERFSRTGRIPHRESHPTSYYSQSLFVEEDHNDGGNEQQGVETSTSSFPLENEVVWSIHDAGDRVEPPDYSLPMEQPETAHEIALQDTVPQPQPHPPPRLDTKKRSDKPIHPGRGVVVALSNTSLVGDAYPTEDKEEIIGPEMDRNGPETIHDDANDGNSEQQSMRVINGQSVEEDAALTTVSTGVVVNENLVVVNEAVNTTTIIMEAETEGILAPVNVLADVEGQTISKDAASAAAVNSIKSDGVDHNDVSTENNKAGIKVQPTKPSPAVHYVVHKPRAPVHVISPKRRKGKGITTKKKKTDDVIETTVGLKPVGVISPLPSTVSSVVPQQQPLVETKAVTFAEEVIQEQPEIPMTTLDSHTDPSHTTTTA